MRPAPLLIGGSGGLLAMVLLAPLTGSALGRLATARAERARLEAAAIAPRDAVAGIPAEFYIRADSRASAAAQVIARVRTLAGRSGVLVEEASPVDAPQVLAAVRVRLSGSEGAVLGLVDTLEREAPLIRFVEWRIEGGRGTVRLLGEVDAPWR